MSRRGNHHQLVRGDHYQQQQHYPRLFQGGGGEHRLLREEYLREEYLREEDRLHEEEDRPYPHPSSAYERQCQARAHNNNNLTRSSSSSRDPYRDTSSFFQPKPYLGRTTTTTTTVPATSSLRDYKTHNYDSTSSTSTSTGAGGGGSTSWQQHQHRLQAEQREIQRHHHQHHQHQYSNGGGGDGSGGSSRLTSPTLGARPVLAPSESYRYKPSPTSISSCSSSNMYRSKKNIETKAAYWEQNGAGSYPRYKTTGEEEPDEYALNDAFYKRPPSPIAIRSLQSDIDCPGFMESDVSSSDFSDDRHLKYPEYDDFLSCGGNGGTLPRSPSPEEEPLDYLPRYAAPMNDLPRQQRQQPLQQQQPPKTVEVAPGEFLRLRGADETWRAIEYDFFLPCCCSCCEATIFCISDANCVLCPDCRVISPLENGTTGTEGGVGLGFTMLDLAKWQEDIQAHQQHAQAS